MLYAGARVPECGRLDVEDIVLTARTGQIRLHGKGDQVRTVPLPAPARQAQAAWSDERGTHDGPARTGQRGRMTDSGITQVVLAVGDDAGIPGLRPHRLRPHLRHPDAPGRRRPRPRPSTTWTRLPRHHRPLLLGRDRRAGSRRRGRLQVTRTAFIGPVDGKNSTRAGPLTPLTVRLLLKPLTPVTVRRPGPGPRIAGRAAGDCGAGRTLALYATPAPRAVEELSHLATAAVRDGYTGIRFGGLLPGSTVSPHEHILNQLVRLHPATALCTYHAKAPAEVMTAADQLHDRRAPVRGTVRRRGPADHCALPAPRGGPAERRRRGWSPNDQHRIAATDRPGKPAHHPATGGARRGGR